MRWLGAHVVVTGAGSGIGAALARRLAQEGSSLTLLGRNQERLSAVAAACTELGANTHHHICDVTDAAAVAACLLQADDRQPVRVVVANAGIGGSEVLAAAAGEPVALARKVFETNVMGVIHTVSPLLERLIARRQGHLAIVSSMMAYRGFADAPVYSASKAAARVYGQGLRALVARHGVGVTVVCPGFVATPMSQSLPMATPFVVTADKAAARIMSAIAANKAEVAFPWQLNAAAYLAGAMPNCLTETVLAQSRRRLRHSP